MRALTALPRSLLPARQHGTDGPSAAGFGKSDSEGLGLQQRGGQARRDDGWDGRTGGSDQEG